ncbi:Retrotransposon-derived protein PEG10 [Labeo rohita]|uniref:Retrotransposon-derived protein PEG10 n=1 Tax=Labeo rohita TaxID=84645 RepID=A0ABQ8KZS8_LABRO|nr:Retrotransposon-derived protein PEG10 [Labeo rohita]
MVSTLSTEVETASLTLLPETWHTSKMSLCVSTLVDSGSSGNFISQDCLNQLQLPHHHHSQGLAVKTIQGKPLGCGKIRHSSPYITLQVGLFHSEKIKFLVLEDCTVSVILGRTWLQLHHPKLSWDPCDSALYSSAEPSFTPEIPAEYMAFQDNLQYLREAKRLNSRQARWALFFTRFNFQITYPLAHSDPVCAMIPSGKLVPLPIPQRPWSHIGVDFVTDLPGSEGNTCIMVVVDRFSKMCKDLNSSHTYGKLSSNSSVFLLIYPLAKYAQNSLRQDTTGLTPFQCVLGYQPPLFPWTEEPSNVPAVEHWFRESKGVWDSAHHHLQCAVRQQKRFADVRRRPAPAYQPGDQVWLSTRDLRLRQPCRKLSPRYIRLFKILRQINDVTFQLQLPLRYRIHPTFHVSLLKPFYPSATETPGAEAEPPPPEVLDQPSIYAVHEILDLRDVEEAT